MNRIEKTLAHLGGRNEKAIAMFLTAGFPRKDSTVDLVLAIEQGGADIVELGMPFSDPLADGPVIQASSAAALKNGVTLRTVLDDARMIRRNSGIPLVLMGYLNPILSFGATKFFEEAAAAGIDGVILPEVPLEEWPRFGETVRASGLAGILLATPTTPDKKIAAIDAEGAGFLYCVSSTGVTGAAHRTENNDYLRRVKSIATKNRVLVGFGIASPDDAAAYASSADGVIVGTALLRQIGSGISGSSLSSWVAGFRSALSARY